MFDGCFKGTALVNNLRTFTSDSSRQLDILRHDGDSLGVDRAQVGVFEQANQVRFGRFLQRQDRGGLESQVSLEILGDFSDQTLERQLSDEQFRGLLVLSDFSQRDGTRAVSVRLLDATSRRRRFARGFRRELLSRGFATCSRYSFKEQNISSVFYINVTVDGFDDFS